MPIYIYRSGGSPNPPPQNPLLRFLISAGVLAAVIGFGILLLPVIGAIALFILGLIAVLVIGGLIYRWLYGNPLEKFYQREEGVRVNPASQTDERPVHESQKESELKARKMKFRSREQTVEDAIVVQETKRGGEPR